jgi:hypothetical protein
MDPKDVATLKSNCSALQSSHETLQSNYETAIELLHSEVTALDAVVANEAAAADAQASELG